MKQIFHSIELFLTESIIILILYSSFNFGQTEEWIVFNTINSPLEDNAVNVVKHDKYDNIWIGTNYGLMKYDGNFWNLYTTANSDLPSNLVDILVMDKHSNFWFIINPSNYPHFIKFDGTEWIKIDTNQTCILWGDDYLFAVDGKEVKWIYGASQPGPAGIIRFSQDSCNIYDVDLSYLGMQDFQVDQNNHFWFCTDNADPYTGVAKFDNSQWIYLHRWVVGLAVDTLYNETWAIGAAWIDKIDFNDLSVIATYSVPFSNVYLVGIFAGKDYNLWCITPGDGVLKFNRTSTTFTHYNTLNSGLPSDSVYYYAIDDSLNVWMATQNGLAVFNETGIILKHSISNKDTLDFGVVSLNDSLSQSFIISNPLQTNIIIDSVNINSTVFNYNGSVPITIEPGNSEEFTVDFTPDSLIEYKCKLTLHTNRGMKSILLTGVCDIPPFAYNGRDGLNEYQLFQNYPNPFNPVTTINYQIPERGFVTLKVYDVLGNEVATLVNEEKSAGSYEVKFNASILTSGIYFYKMRAGNFVETKKLILLK